MRIQSLGISHPGLIRDHNEDSFMNNDKDGLFLVADGMGGLSKGDLASRIAIETIQDFIRKSRLEDITWPTKLRQHYSLEENRFLAAISLANWNIFNEMLRNPKNTAMGTTLVGLLVDGEKLVLANIGDSRAYRIRDNTIQQLTNDHSLVMEEVRRGLITQEEARAHPQKHIVSRALGISDSPEVDISSLEVQENDLYLLCSDGLSDMVPDEEIRFLVQSNRNNPLKELGQKLIDAANNRGGKDNITIVLARFSEAP
ncbi:MAG: Stp1/IreP family PP2C-type Ser/Thr phosphatase [Desulfobacteraceae bacterium]